MSAELPEIEVTDAPVSEEVDVPIGSSNEPSEVEDNIEDPAEKTFNPKTDKVDFDKPEQQARFNEIYRQLQKSDQRNLMLTDFLAEQQRQLDEVRTGFSQIKTEKVQTEQAEAEKILMQRIQTAREAADDTAYDNALSELITFRSTQEASKLFDAKVNEFRKQETVQAENYALQVKSAMEEKDESGNYLRPWLQEEHEQNAVAIYHIKKISSKFNENDPNIVSKTLKELDQVMSAQMKKTEPPKDPPAQNRTPNPMQGTNLTNQKPKGTIKMTRVEADIFKKLERHSGKKIDLKKYEARRSAMTDAKGGR
jgi:hypothetical protein